jgi:choline kinase
MSTLVILAAGMASRYGSMKQTQSFGPSGETIMEYSIYDAIEAGFTKVVFIIRKDFAETFQQMVESRIGDRIVVNYVYQQLDSFTNGYEIPAERSKPWGTAHAVLCCKDVVNEPFAVINADDFYGKDAFVKAHDFLTNRCNEKTFAVIGYELSNTLSENGSVSRGVIATNASNEMTGIDERLDIYRRNDGQIVYKENNVETTLSADTKVSMNFFCFGSQFIDLCLAGFQPFLSEKGQELKSEYLMPKMADSFIKSSAGIIELVPTSAKWFGVTYKEDAPVVQSSIDNLVQNGVYPNNLWA